MLHCFEWFSLFWSLVEWFQISSRLNFLWCLQLFLCVSMCLCIVITRVTLEWRYQRMGGSQQIKVWRSKSPSTLWAGLAGLAFCPCVTLQEYTIRYLLYELSWRHTQQGTPSRRHHRQLRRDEIRNHVRHFWTLCISFVLKHFQIFARLWARLLRASYAALTFRCMVSYALTSLHLVLRFSTFHAAHVIQFAPVAHTLAIRVPPAATRLTVYRWLLMFQRGVMTHGASARWLQPEE